MGRWWQKRLQHGPLGLAQIRGIESDRMVGHAVLRHVHDDLTHTPLNTDFADSQLDQQPASLLRGHGSTREKALHKTAVHGSHQLELLLGLDALRNHFQTQPSAE